MTANTSAPNHTAHREAISQLKRRQRKQRKQGEDGVWLTCNEDSFADGSAACNMLWISVIQDTISGLQTFTLHIQQG